MGASQAVSYSYADSGQRADSTPEITTLQGCEMEGRGSGDGTVEQSVYLTQVGHTFVNTWTGYL